MDSNDSKSVGYCGIMSQSFLTKTKCLQPPFFSWKKKRETLPLKLAPVGVIITRKLKCVCIEVVFNCESLCNFTVVDSVGKLVL